MTRQETSQHERITIDQFRWFLFLDEEPKRSMKSNRELAASKSKRTRRLAINWKLAPLDKITRTFTSTVSREVKSMLIPPSQGLDNLNVVLQTIDKMM